MPVVDAKDQWLPSLNLTFEGENVLLGSEWLNDSIISAALQHLKQSAVMKTIGGLQSPLYGQNLSFKAIKPRGKYVQILHVDQNLWIAVSNMSKCMTE